MVTDAQVRRLMKRIHSGDPLSVAAAKADMDEKTARKYRRAAKLPSQVKVAHTWRNRPDAFVQVWPEIQQALELNPGLQAKTLFQYLQRQRPGFGFASCGERQSFSSGVASLLFSELSEVIPFPPEVARAGPGAARCAPYSSTPAPIRWVACFHSSGGRSPVPDPAQVGDLGQVTSAGSWPGNDVRSGTRSDALTYPCPLRRGVAPIQ